MKRTTLSFLTESKVSHVSLLSIRRVAITLLVMLLTTASAWAEFPTPTIYQLSLNDNYQGGAIGMADVPVSNPTYTLTSNDEPIRTGYTFLGWSTSSTGIVKYRTGDKVTLDGNLTLYAIWEDPYMITLIPSYDGGVVKSIPVPRNHPNYTLTSRDEPTRARYMFCGWSTSSTGAVQYRTNDQIPLTGNLTLYAVWSLNMWGVKEYVVGSLKYKITKENPEQVELSGYEGNKPTGTLDIPATVIIDNEEYSVTRIGEKAFYQCKNITSITIPNSVTSIGHAAFSECNALGSIFIPNSVMNIGIEAFAYCGLKSVTIPDNMTSIGNRAFFCCRELKSVIIPKSVRIIGEQTFSGCSGLESVTIPNSVTSIGHEAFYDCKKLTSVTINGNPKIGDDAFLKSPATVTMNLTASQIGNDYWTTFYNDGYYNFQADGNTKVYKGTVNESSLMLTEVEDKIVNSGTAVILKSSGKPVMTLTETRSSDTNGNDLQGISDRTKRTSVISNFNANEIYTMGNTSAGFGFHKYTGEFVPAQKAFLPLNTSNGAKAQSLTIVFAIGATGINSVSSDSNEQNDWFSLDGTRLSGKPSQPGIYVNGKKKVVVK